VYGVALAGWASNNKYSLFGGLRSSAQMISYELSLSLGVLGSLLLSGSLSLRHIVDSQAGYYWGFLPRWNLFHGPWPQVVGFLVYLTAAFAETNRVPFDLPEAETELVAGFHTEYSSMKFAMFFMAEYANMITVACLATVLFLGGWHPPLPESWGINYAPVLVGIFLAVVLFSHSGAALEGKHRRSMQIFGMVAALAGLAFLAAPVRAVFSPLFWFLAKSGFFLFLYIWVRGTLPRFRYDQLMSFGWKVLFPVGVANVLVTALLVAVFG
jgi:NADH-quinone oxidoreductase subunit H